MARFLEFPAQLKIIKILHLLLTIEWTSDIWLRSLGSVLVILISVKIIKSVFYKKNPTSIKMQWKRSKISPQNSVRILFLGSNFRTADKKDRVNENPPWFYSADKPLMLVHEQLISVGKMGNNYLTGTLIMFSTRNEWDAHLDKMHSLLLFATNIQKNRRSVTAAPGSHACIKHVLILNFLFWRKNIS